MLAIIAAQLNGSDMTMRASQIGNDARRCVLATIIHQYDFIVVRDPIQNRLQRITQRTDGLRCVVDGDDDRN